MKTFRSVVIALGGILSGIWSVFLFRSTFISIYSILLILVFGTLLGYLIFKSLGFAKYESWTDGFIVFGLFGLSIVLSVNDFFASRELEVHYCELVKRTRDYGSRPGGSGSHYQAIVKYKGRTKRFFYDNQEASLLHGASYMKLQTSEGFLGWDIVQEKQLLRESDYENEFGNSADE